MGGIGVWIQDLFSDEPDEPWSKAYVIDTTDCEARQAARQQALIDAGWTEGHQRQLADYCDVFEIDVATIESDAFFCTQVLLDLFLIPPVESVDDRNAQGNEIRVVMAQQFSLSNSEIMRGGSEPELLFFNAVSVPAGWPRQRANNWCAVPRCKAPWSEIRAAPHWQDWARLAVSLAAP